jgi:tetratricopeptide (TPR) repeat protein
MWEAHLFRGLSYARRGAHAQAIADYGRAIELKPNDAQAFARRSYSNRAIKYLDRAFADAEQAIALAPYYGYAHRQRALVHLERRHFEKAIADLERSMEHDPHEDILYFERAQAWEGLGKHELALADLERAVAMDPRHAPYLENRARLYMHFERWREAIEDLDAALSLVANNIHALRRRALAHEKAGQREAAIADYRAVLRTSPYDTDSQAALRRLSAPTGTADGASCRDPRMPVIDRVADCSRAIQTAKTREQRAVAYFARSQIYGLVMRQLDKALEDVEQAMKHKPGWAEAHSYRGLVRMWRGDPKAALADFDRAIELDPKIAPNMLLSRATARIELKLYAPALADIDRVFPLMPNNPAVFYTRGLAHERMGKREQAIGDYREALKIFPQFQPPRDGLRRLGVQL